MTSSITSIVNIITYVLIAFVAVSLVVSCIMIGIITHISVMERTKEIGILRALGASKRNISQVFNAETIIIGLCSGLLGVGLTALLTIPANAMVAGLLGSGGTLTISLPIGYAAILVVLSVAITLIGGLLPARKAAHKDPVIALRTE
ncbi:MAG: FtsX-like permease family protein [Bifidobacterium scardovii]|nr:FtsX-like permease family protein [Bifidobacterium scardovii]MBS6947897.1 FtsX-like permease family protein [Bifidobacterium scardovii]